MNARITKISPDDIRQNILDAASERFIQFGYNKTTMAEIAQDCGMSAANLYRYFKNKLDLGANLACRCLDDKVEQSLDITMQQNRPASERLHDMVLQTLHFTHEQWSQNPRMNEMVNAICDARMDIVIDYKQNEHALLVDLLEDGIKAGEFNITDVNDCATAIACAITAFSMPQMMPLCSLDDLERQAKSVIKLLLHGLIKQ